MGSSGLTDPQAYQTNQVSLEFGDGRYLFKLGLKQLAELQEKCDAGVGEIYSRVSIGNYYILDLLETIRLGLVGGGEGIVSEQDVKVSPEKAMKLVERYCDRPLEQNWMIAKAILDACVIGYSNPDASPGKETAVATGNEQTGLT